MNQSCIFNTSAVWSHYIALWMDRCIQLLVFFEFCFCVYDGLYTWTSPDGQHWNQTDSILCSQRWRTSIQSAKTRPGTDCGSDHELLIAKFRSKLKNVGKNTRPFRYDLNQIPYNYIVEERIRFKGLDMIEWLMNYGRRFMTLYRIQGSRPFPRKRNEKKKSGCLRRPYK